MSTTESLAVKYRPQTLAGIIGNQGAKDIIQGFVSQGRFHPAIMLSGGTGLGKTTLARIIASHLVCSSGTICGKCHGCKSRSASTDIKEVDVGDERGIDAIRALKSLASVRPMFGKNRVIILDEIHALTSQGASALLKTLEEPPANTVFILCTTDPEKVMNTIRGRCTSIKVLQPTLGEFARHLKKIAGKEGVTLTNEHKGILKKMYKLSAGHIRNGIQMLESLIAAMRSNEELDENRLLDIFLSNSDLEGERLAAMVVAGVLKGDPSVVIKNTVYITNRNEFASKLRILINALINEYAGAQRGASSILMLFKEYYSINDFGLDLRVLLRIGMEAGKAELALRTGLDEATLRYSLVLMAAQIQDSAKQG